MQAKIDSVLSKAVADGAVAAVSAVVCNTDGIVYEGAFGQTSPGGEAMRVDTVGAIMSMTKAITGAAAMQLVEQGKLDLDAPAGEICPHLGEVQVLTGYDEEGQPTFRPHSEPTPSPAAGGSGTPPLPHPHLFLCLCNAFCRGRGGAEEEVSPKFCCPSALPLSGGHAD